MEATNIRARKIGRYHIQNIGIARVRVIKSGGVNKEDRLSIEHEWSG